MSLADNYSRRIKAAVARLSSIIYLSRPGSPPTDILIRPIFLPGAVLVVSSTAGAADIRAAAAGSAAATITGGTSPSAAAGSSSTSALPSIQLLQDTDQNLPHVGDSLTVDSVSWTVQSVASIYVQAQRVAILSTATAAAVS